jgi:NADH-quinone oxidoreductase subunit F
MLETLERICAGRGRPDDLEALKELGESIKRSSLCGLGQTAPNPVLTTLRYFEKEYREHIEDKRCSAKVCKDLISYAITGKCTGCTLCAKRCPVSAITGKPKALHIIDDARCVRCGVCFDVCRFGAVEVFDTRSGAVENRRP